MIKKFELAFQYFPKAPNKKAAVANLRNAIKRCKELHARLQQVPGGYDPNAKTLTSRQVELIKLYLGEP